MGTWDTGIFSDDLAADVRGRFREHIGDGLSAEEATERILKDFEVTVEDSDAGLTFWIALAAAQSRCGRLLDMVRERAVKIIDGGGDLQRWDDSLPKYRAARQAALAKLRDELTGPQRNPTRIARVYRDRTDWGIGHAISYKLKSGRLVLMRVLAIDDGKSRIPVVELCDWIGEVLPSRSEIEKLPTRHTKWYGKRHSNDPKLDRFGDEHDHKFTVYAMSKRQFPADRVAVVATGLQTPQTNCEGITFFGGWKYLDDYLRRQYGIE